MNPSISPRFHASCCARSTDRISAIALAVVCLVAAEAAITIRIQEMMAIAHESLGVRGEHAVRVFFWATRRKAFVVVRLVARIPNRWTCLAGRGALHVSRMSPEVEDRSFATLVISYKLRSRCVQLEQEAGFVSTGGNRFDGYSKFTSIVAHPDK